MNANITEDSFALVEHYYNQLEVFFSDYKIIMFTAMMNGFILHYVYMYRDCQQFVWSKLPCLVKGLAKNIVDV